MATYREIHGKAIKSVSSDPSDDYVAGQVWYNTTSDTFKTVVLTEAWRSEQNMPDNRGNVGGNIGAADTTLVVGGQITYPNISNITNEFNGSGWRTEGTLPWSQNWGQGGGIITAAWFNGGETSKPAGPVVTTTATFDGTSWTGGTASPASRVASSGTGPQTAGLVWGGKASWPASDETTSFEYDGEWTSGGTLSFAQSYAGGAGTQTNAISVGGGPPGKGVQSYNGTAFSSETEYPAAFSQGSVVGANQDAVIAFAYSPPQGSTTTSAKYDGTSWTTAPSLGTGRYAGAGRGGTQAAAIGAGGYKGPPGARIANVEAFNSSTDVITAAAWASASGLVGSAREHIGGAGSSTSGLAFGGESAPTNYNETEEWNGSSWTAGGAYPSKDESIMGCGLTASTALAFGGIGNAPGSPPVTRQAISAKYDGSSWTTTNSLPTAKRAGQGFGINTSAVCMGGDTSPTATQNTVEEWDGTNWTAVPNAPFAKGNMGGGTGTLTAGLVFGGQSGTATGTTYEYDGTNWTAGGTMATARTNVNGFGGPAGQTASICAGGYSTTQTAVTEGYDGTAWSSRPSLGTARMGSANGIGTSQTAGVQAGGHDTSTYVTTVEEWTGETTAVNVKTLTQS